jgi:predicted Rdx family selenoprotein
MSQIELSETGRSELERYLSREKTNVRNIKRAQILLKSVDGWSAARIVETFGDSIGGAGLQPNQMAMTLFSLVDSQFK